MKAILLSILAGIQSLPFIIPPGLNSEYFLETKVSKKVSATYSYTVQAPKLNAKEWILFLPKPINLPSQKILSVKTDPESTVVNDSSPLQQPLFQVRVAVKGEPLSHGITLKVSVEAELFSRTLKPAKQEKPLSPVEALNKEERELCLRSSSQFDYLDKSLKSWIAKTALHRKTSEGEIDFARRVFSAIAKNYSYEYIGEQDRSASNVCAAGKSDCGGLSNLFVTVLRSQGIPARTLAGRWAISAKPGEQVGKLLYFQEHVKAEFFAEGVGWVPADLSSAILHDRSKEKLEYFGNDRGDFITFHRDSELSFDTIYFGKKTMTLLQKASFWATGEGSFDNAVISENWVVH